MKFIIAVCFLNLIIACTHKIYIVRHGEKSSEPPKNPHLSKVGQQRAQNLILELKAKHITQIYSTNTFRTMETAMPLSKHIKVPVTIYINDTTSKLMAYIFNSKKNALIVGHSNTILNIIDSLQYAYVKDKVKDTEYDNLIVVKYKKYCPTCSKKFIVKNVVFKKYTNYPYPFL